MSDPQSKWFWKSKYEKAEAERDRLREALEMILRCDHIERAQQIARDALAGEEEK